MAAADPSLPELGIVTAFFDIGRGDWAANPDTPDHLRRSTKLYFERFAAMAALDNALVVYTSADLVARVQQMRAGKEDRTVVIAYDFAGAFPERRAEIERIQKDPAFIDSIHPTQCRNPEYWSVDYILVTNLKSFFVAHAVQNQLIRTPLVAWADFGLFRNPQALGGKTRWEYPFTPDKAHLLCFSKYNNEFSIPQIVTHNIAYIVGGLIVAPPHLWPRIAQLAAIGIQTLAQHKMVDDDQTVMLLAYLQQPDLFEQHLVGPNDWERIMDIFHI